jgi:hypothetical protein
MVAIGSKTINIVAFRLNRLIAFHNSSSGFKKTVNKTCKRFFGYQEQFFPDWENGEVPGKTNCRFYLYKKALPDLFLSK